MATDYKIKDQKLQYDIEAAKIRDLSYRKIDKYEYLRGEEILLSHQRQMIEQARFTYSSLGKDFEKKKKINWRASKKTKRCKMGSSIQKKLLQRCTIKLAWRRSNLNESCKRDQSISGRCGLLQNHRFSTSGSQVGKSLKRWNKYW